MQETQNRISQHDISSHPTRIRVIGYTYLVDFGQSTQPRFHTVNKQRSCSCSLKETCPAIEAVAEYLRNGGQRAPDPMPPWSGDPHSQQRKGSPICTGVGCESM